MKFQQMSVLVSLIRQTTLGTRHHLALSPRHADSFTLLIKEHLELRLSHRYSYHERNNAISEVTNIANWWLDGYEMGRFSGEEPCPKGK